jgi:hypothetical protein
MVDDGPITISSGAALIISAMSRWLSAIRSAARIDAV